MLSNNKMANKFYIDRQDYYYFLFFCTFQFNKKMSDNVWLTDTIIYYQRLIYIQQKRKK